MNAIFLNYRGWLLTFSLAIALSILISHRGARSISGDYVRNLTKKQEIAGITIVDTKPDIRERYIAEITLTPAAQKKYDQLGAAIPSSEKGPHFVSAIGSSERDVSRWKEGLHARNKIRFSSVRRY